MKLRIVASARAAKRKQSTEWLHGAEMAARVQVQPVNSLELQLQPAKTCKHEKSTEGPNISLGAASQVRGRKS